MTARAAAIIGIAMTGLVVGVGCASEEEAAPREAGERISVQEELSARMKCKKKEGLEGNREIALLSGGLLRSALVHVPESYKSKKDTALVLNFHYFTGTPEDQAVLSQMNEVSDARGFIVAYPAGIGGSFNFGSCCGPAWQAGVDDVQFARDLVAAIAEEYCIDPRRVYATGMSNGGALAHRLGCEAADVFAAIAPVAAILPEPSTCSPSRPISVLHIHGTADPLIPYDGSTPNVPPGVPSPAGTFEFYPVEESMGIWQQMNNCPASPALTYANGDASCVAWSPCDRGTATELCTIHGGGHTWPGGAPIPGVGPTSNDLEASEKIIDFFEAHPM
jgi:polyhydroxybutyrate depolymerase